MFVWRIKLYLCEQACTVNELYGYLDHSTQDWIDGLFSNIFRRINSPTDTENVSQIDRLCIDMTSYSILGTTICLFRWRRWCTVDRECQFGDGWQQIADVGQWRTHSSWTTCCTIIRGKTTTSNIRGISASVLFVQVGNLMYASPATVSRAAMVYVDPKNLGYEPYWMRWLTRRPTEEHDKFNVGHT